MKTQHKILLFLTSLLMFCGTCRKDDAFDCHYSITVHNTSNVPIYVDAIIDAPLVHSGQMPSPFNVPETQKVFGMQVDRGALLMRDCWETTLGTGGRVGIYFFNDSLSSMPWDSIVANHLFTELDLNLDDLRNMNFEVSYP